ncbi:MAG: hypothetical protein AB1485_00895 [Candidatus Thermoplasmatota archaeon]
MKEFTAWAKKKKMKYITLYVMPENKIGVKFWREHGFKTMLLNQIKII